MVGRTLQAKGHQAENWVTFDPHYMHQVKSYMEILHMIIAFVPWRMGDTAKRGDSSSEIRDTFVWKISDWGRNLSRISQVIQAPGVHEMEFQVADDYTAI